MRRHDKKIHMEKVNHLFEQRCNENRTNFNWNGKYENEDEVEEGIDEVSAKQIAKRDISKNLKNKPKDKEEWEPSSHDNYDIGTSHIFTSDSGKLNKKLQKNYPDMNPYKDAIKNIPNHPLNKKEQIVSLGDDIEIVDETCDCDPNPTTPGNQWFSDRDGELATDKDFN